MARQDRAGGSRKTKRRLHGKTKPFSIEKLTSVFPATERSPPTERGHDTPWHGERFAMGGSSGPRGRLSQDKTPFAWKNQAVFH